MDQKQVQRGFRSFIVCIAVLMFVETSLAASCAVVLRDWTLLLTGVGRVGMLVFLSRWALSGQRWGRMALAFWLGSHMVLSALGAMFITFFPDALLQWVPHNRVVQALPHYYWAFPASRLAVLLMAAIVVFCSPAVTVFWERQRTRRIRAMSPVAWLSLATGVLAFVAWRIAVA